jgi:hypothetical protein
MLSNKAKVSQHTAGNNKKASRDDIGNNNRNRLYTSNNNIAEVNVAQPIKWRLKKRYGHSTVKRALPKNKAIMTQNCGKKNNLPYNRKHPIGRCEARHR